MLIRASAKFHLRLGSPQVAAELLQELHRYVNHVYGGLGSVFESLLALNVKTYFVILLTFVVLLSQSVQFFTKYIFKHYYYATTSI